MSLIHTGDTLTVDGYLGIVTIEPKKIARAIERLRETEEPLAVNDP